MPTPQNHSPLAAGESESGFVSGHQSNAEPGRVLEVLDRDALGCRVHLVHTRTEDNGTNPVPVHHVRVAAPATRHQRGLEADPSARVRHLAHQLVVLRKAVPKVGGLYLALERRAMPRARLLQAPLHMLGLGLQFCRIAAAHLADQLRPFGNDVRRVLGDEAAEVRRRASWKESLLCFL